MVLTTYNTIHLLQKDIMCFDGQYVVEWNLFISSRTSVAKIRKLSL